MDASLDTPLAPQESKKERLGVGPMVAIALLILVFAAGGVYFFVREKALLNTPPVQETINA
ncbi:MAG: hypothetical protein V4474_01475 [Patescibacteria group bacterium]